MRRFPLNSLERMTGIRDVAESVARHLNPFLPVGLSLRHSRMFLHRGDGFGYYCRFRKAAEWDDLDRRIARFFSAVSHCDPVWSDFIEWAASPDTIDRFDSDRIEETYDRLLGMMIGTPAAWGDNAYWRLHHEAACPFQPFLANFERNAVDIPWSLTCLRADPDGFHPIGTATIDRGDAPEDAPKGAAHVFWEILYPLCNRVDYDPPQDPTKGTKGTISQIVLPIPESGSGDPIAWVLCNLEVAGEYEALNGFLRTLENLDDWLRVRAQLSGLLRDHQNE